MLVKSMVKIGGVTYQFECDERSEKEAMSKAIVFASPPLYCDVCKNMDPLKFKMTTSKDKEGHIYIKVKCINKGCGATCSLGTYKDGTGYFWRRPYEIYDPKKPATTTTETTATTAPTSEPAQPTTDPDDIPF